jgi:hypothetical protein
VNPGIASGSPGGPPRPAPAGQPPEPPPRRWRRLRRLVPGILLALFFALAVEDALWMSPTFDEPFHLTAGYAALRYGDFRFGPNHPPLIRMWSAIPAVLDGRVRFPREQEDYRKGRQYGTATHYCFLSNSVEPLLFGGRLMVILLATALGWLVYRGALRLFGFPAAAMTLGLFVLEPNVMAHGNLVTTDLGVTFFFFLATWSLWLLVRRITAPRLFGLAAFFALAQLSKFSALVLWPAVAVVLLGRALDRGEWRVGWSGKRLVGRLRKGAAAAGVFALVVLFFFGFTWSAYRFRYEMAPAPGLQVDTSEDPEFQISDRSMGEALSSIRVLPEGYVRGAAQLLTWPQETFYFAGKLRSTPVWYFFPTVLLVKTPTALLALSFLGIALVARRGNPWPEGWPALAAPPVFLLLAGMASGVNTGVRHLLPILPFLLLAAGAGASVLFRARRGRAVLAMLAVFAVAEFSSVYPDVLASYNFPSGGAERGDRWLAASDLDWGQGLKALGHWMRRHGVDRINLACHTELYDSTLGYHTRRLPTYLNPQFPVDVPEFPGYVALSESVSSGYTSQGRYTAFYAPLLKMKPVAWIGRSIRVYYVERPWWKPA